MSIYRTLVFFLVVITLSGCATTRGVFLIFPESNGLVEISSGVFVEESASIDERNQLKRYVGEARDAVKNQFGSVTSTPTIHACLTEECYQRFGGNTEIAKVFGDYILLSPRGFNWHFIAHEWSHAEVLKRLTIRSWLKFPQWFDEGVATVVSQAPEHSDMHYTYLLSKGIAVPTQEELYSYVSNSQWIDAVRKFGDNLNPERRKRGEEEYHVLYSTVAHEVGPWLRKNGTNGLLQLIDGLNAGETFNSIYFSKN